MTGVTPVQGLRGDPPRPRPIRRPSTTSTAAAPATRARAASWEALPPASSLRTDPRHPRRPGDGYRRHGSIHHPSSWRTPAASPPPPLFKGTSDLPKGDINWQHLRHLKFVQHPLPGESVTGPELKGLHGVVRRVLQPVAGGGYQYLLRPRVPPDYLYDMFAGVDYEIDSCLGQRIQNVMFQGPLQDDQADPGGE